MPNGEVQPTPRMMGTMNTAAENWHCAKFRSTPNLDVLNAYRKLLGCRLPIFFERVGPNDEVGLYLPPGAERFVRSLNAGRELEPFTPCDRPTKDRRFNVLFGEDADLRVHFPLQHAEMLKHSCPPEMVA